MEQNTIAHTRELLQSGEASITGRVSEVDKKVLREIDRQIREVAGRITMVFKIVFGDSEMGDLVEVLSGVYAKMAKGYLRARKKEPELAITKEELGAFWIEIQDVIGLFNKNNINVDQRLLERVMTFGGYAYWKEFFELEFQDFLKTNWIVRHAIINNSKDPRAFLRKVQVDVRVILAEEEFADFVKAPSVVRYVVVRSKDPRAFLRKLQVDVRVILAEEEFADFVGTPSVVRYAAVNHHKDPRAFLRKVQADLKVILAEEEFVSFGELPWIVRHAVVEYKDPRAFLRSDKWTKMKL